METVSKLSTCCFEGRKEATVMGAVPMALNMAVSFLWHTVKLQVHRVLLLLL